MMFNVNIAFYTPAAVQRFWQEEKDEKETLAWKNGRDSLDADGGYFRQYSRTLRTGRGGRNNFL